MSPGSKGPAIEAEQKRLRLVSYFIGKDSTLQGADGRAAIQKNRSEGQLYVLARTGTTVTCKGGYRAAGIGGSWAIRNIEDSMFRHGYVRYGVDTCTLALRAIPTTGAAPSMPPAASTARA
ncbi:MAG: hypothetical protein ACLSHJ_00815 [Oscillospiraceae bacterium]